MYARIDRLTFLFPLSRPANNPQIKAHTAPDELYVQVGGQNEFSTWGPPEAMLTAPRVGYKIDAQNPGSEPAAEAAAALAAGALVFSEADPQYAATLLQHARQLYDFADRCRGNFVTDGHITEAAPFYGCVCFVLLGKETLKC